MLIVVCIANPYDATDGNGVKLESQQSDSEIDSVSTFHSTRHGEKITKDSHL